MSKVRKRISVLMLMTVLLLSACGSTASVQDQMLPQDELMNEKQANYKTTQVIRGTFQETDKGRATAVYLYRENLVWEGKDAYYGEILVKKGQAVKAGDPLAVFEIEVSEVDLKTLQLNLQRTKEDVEKQKAERLNKIAEAQAKAALLESYDLEIQKKTIEKLQASYEQYAYQSDRQIAQIQEKIDVIEEKLANNTLYAPFDGVVETVVNYNQGDPVPRGTTLITMYSTDKMLLKASDSTGKLRYNMDVSVEVKSKSGTRTVTGKVVMAKGVLPTSISAEYALIELDDVLTETEQKGTLTYYCVVEEYQDVLLVASRAVHSEGSLRYVYVLDGEMVQKRYVAEGLNNSEYTWILDGLTEGQTLILD